MKLYNYFRSSASYRVRIALALKNLPYDYVSVHLARGDHRLPEFAQLVADPLVPMLELDDGERLTQSGHFGIPGRGSTPACLAACRCSGPRPCAGHDAVDRL